MVYKIFDQKKTELGVSLNKVLAQELKEGKCMRSLKIIFGQLKNRGVKYLLFVIDVFFKYALIKSLKDNKAKIVLHGNSK